jgi:hypothetical protein
MSAMALTTRILRCLQTLWRRMGLGAALLLLAACRPCARRQPQPPPQSFAFYYGTDIPWESLGAFDVAVVEPGNVSPAGWPHRLNPDTTVAAYISVGEVHPTRSYFTQVRPEWRLGENTAWGSIVVDQAAPGWNAFYLAQVIKPLWDQGFRAFFLDTLDSFQLTAKTPEAQQRQIAGLVSLVREIKRAYPTPNSSSTAGLKSCRRCTRWPGPSRPNPCSRAGTRASRNTAPCRRPTATGCWPSCAAAQTSTSCR